MGEVKFCLFKPQDKLMWECLRNLEEIVSLPASSSFFFFFFFYFIYGASVMGTCFSIFF